MLIINNKNLHKYILFIFIVVNCIGPYFYSWWFFLHELGYLVFGIGGSTALFTSFLSYKGELNFPTIRIPLPLGKYGIPPISKFLLKRSLRKQIKKLEKRMEKMVEKDPAMPRLIAEWEKLSHKLIFI